MYFPFLIPKSGRKRSAHSRRRFIQSFPKEKKNNTPEEIFRGQRLKKASQSLPPAGGK